MTPGTDVTLWRIPLPEKSPGPQAWALLDDRERQRAERFIHDRDRHRFVAAHAGLRLALAAETGQPPRALGFTATPGGKPQLERHALSFNLSHSGAIAVVATCRGSAVGVDVEMAGRLRDLDGLAGMVMTPDEQARFAVLPQDLRQVAFMRVWTRKEALLKADGRGLTYDPRKVEVDIDDGAERTVVLEGISWTLRDVALAPDLAAAVCVSGPLASIRQRSVAPLA
ncbi:4'-phosphopantetheinyl transferase family protein [Shumkonia mesophila]|uniref:4'-phosphopantetheinyl transferase family protein n=1 Tax=Shumkonia mesophila TaxID=2838854 RepID=UPI002934479A|nr:4'-phosphopantetheinyl transferase superfamily protein [Shumkonia mesophila]